MPLGLFPFLNFYTVTLQFRMREPQLCNVLCRVELDPKSSKAFKEKIEDEYRVNMYVDVLIAMDKNKFL